MWYKWPNILFKSILIALFTMIYFEKLLFHYVLTYSVKCFICSVASRLLSSSVFVHRPHWCVYFQILYNTMDFWKWKINLIWSCKLIICYRITQHPCWRVGMQLFACATIACLNKYWCVWVRASVVTCHS